MSKYWLIFLQSFSQFMAYRLQVLLTIVQSFITPAFMLFALAGARPTSSLTASGLLAYYLLIAVTYPLVNSNVDDEISQLTQTGEINNFLTKPVSLYRFLFIKDFSRRLINLLSILPLFIPIYLFLTRSQRLSPGWENLTISLIGLFASFILVFSFSYLVGLFSFWIDEFWAIHNVKHVLIQLLGGVVLPYTFFPGRISAILKVSPFPYMVSWAPRILQGQAQLLDLPVVLGWNLIFLILIRILQKKAITMYSFTSN